MSVRSLFHSLLLCLLTLCVGGMGPAVLAAAPRSMSPGAEEERSHAETNAIGDLARSALRPKHAGDDDFRKRAIAGESVKKLRPRGDTPAANSLRTLNVRIQV